MSIIKPSAELGIPVIIFIILVIVGTVLYFQSNTEPAQPATTENKSNKTCLTHEGKEHCAEDYLGMTQADATAQAQRNGLMTYRFLNQDVEGGTIVDGDLVSHRFNFTLSGGKVVKVTFG